MSQYTLEATHEDVPYAITDPTGARDAEGNVVPIDGLTYTLKSNNETAISVIADPGNPKAGTLHIGAPNADGSPATAVVTLEATNAAGAFVGLIDTDTFIVGPGAIASVEGGGLEFPTLTPDPV